MKPNFADVLADFDYAFPPELIAQKPAHPRDSAKLAVVDRKSGTVRWSDFRSIGKFLPKDAVLVLNKTKVIPAKLIAKRSTGGSVSLLSLGVQGKCMRAFANRKLRIGEHLALDRTDGFTVEGSNGKEWLLRPDFPLKQLQKMLARKGEMPLPPYIKHCPLTKKELKEEYQSVFAKDAGSIAAPTASLHFTNRLLKDLEKSGISIVYVTLHVHLGTFAPLTEEQWKSGHLHHEEYVIDAKAKKTLEQAKKERRPIIAVGTTVTRTLESASDRNGKIVCPKGETDLFIREGYDFRLTDGLITNFHVPRSSLLMLVSAFAGRKKILDVYQQAIEKRLRLFSFGDGILIL